MCIRDRHYRDARILPIYEGTTAIQANDLVFRKTLRDNGKAITELVEEINSEISEISNSGNEVLKNLCEKMTQSIETSKKINYPKYDGEFTFDKPSSVYLSGTNHAEDQPCHLLLKDKDLTTNYTLEEYDEPAQRYCPAGVYEIETDSETQKKFLKINSQNCIHCKTCDIKEPSQNIDWITPEGGGGPIYSGT